MPDRDIKPDNVHVIWKQDRGPRESFSGFVRGERVLRVYRAVEKDDTWRVGGSPVLPCFRTYSGKLRFGVVLRRAEAWWTKLARAQFEQLRRLVG
jgi:hypothetical protein